MRVLIHLESLVTFHEHQGGKNLAKIKIIQSLPYDDLLCSRGSPSLGLSPEQVFA